MSNIAIYTTKSESKLVEMLQGIEDINVRLEDASTLKEYEGVVPSLIILEDVPNLKDELMVTKFKVPILFVGPVFTDVTVRAESYDFISSPVNKDELLIRVRSMLKIKEYKDKINKVSTTDELTGLHNRKYLQERLDQEIARARRYKTPLSCLLFDIDFFKVVNDMYGYEWGDVLLKSIADKLKQLIRKTYHLQTLNW